MKNFKIALSAFAFVLAVGSAFATSKLAPGPCPQDAPNIYTTATIKSTPFCPTPDNLQCCIVPQGGILNGVAQTAPQTFLGVRELQ